MMYVVHYVDDFNRKHMTFVTSYKDVEFLKNRFGEITVESYSMK